MDVADALQKRKGSEQKNLFFNGTASLCGSVEGSRCGGVAQLLSVTKNQAVAFWPLSLVHVIHVMNDANVRMTGHSHWLMTWIITCRIPAGKIRLFLATVIFALSTGYG